MSLISAIIAAPHPREIAAAATAPLPLPRPAISPQKTRNSMEYRINHSLQVFCTSRGKGGHIERSDDRLERPETLIDGIL